MSYADRMERERDRRDSELWDAHERGEHVEPEPDCNRCWAVAKEAAGRPRRDWRLDEDGYVRAPLSYENREGDPAFNGAFDRW